MRCSVTAHTVSMYFFIFTSLIYSFKIVNDTSRRFIYKFSLQGITLHALLMGAGLFSLQTERIRYSYEK